ncbi:MAG: DNA repair protein RadA [Candidatus Eisenbacteria bacterium]|nr:DNA repair protein RadA [Candidatus Eisenbacteria bacterium]
MAGRTESARGAGKPKPSRKVFLCGACGDSHSQWYGRCPSCGEWNSLTAYTPPTTDETRRGGPLAGGIGGAVGAKRLSEIPLGAAPRMATGIGELDRVLGGGIVPGSVVLLGGDPGIGKSTLLLQAAGALVARGVRTLYASGEESEGQVRLRAERLEGVPGELVLCAEADLSRIAEVVESAAPAVLVIDSIQSAYLPSVPSAPGSLLQVRESALSLMQLAKRRDMAVCLVGHVTKEGTLAGPRTLEHMVDTVLYMEGERYQHYRILRSVKNRFGGVHEIGVFDMRDDGLREVPNPSQVFLSERTAGAVGSVVVASLEGSRSLLMEVQSLVHECQWAAPQRVAIGYDAKRLAVLLAVLAKRGGVETGRHDVFVNVAGGLRVEEPGVDLGVLLAIASSVRDLPTWPDMVVVGEVGLGGEVRRVAHPERRIGEAARLGYKQVLLPEANRADLARVDGITLRGVRTVAEALGAGLQREGRSR